MEPYSVSTHWLFQRQHWSEDWRSFDDQPNALSETFRDSQKHGDRTHHSACHGEDNSTGCHLPFALSPVWTQDWGTGTLGSYVQLVLPRLHHVERQHLTGELSRHCLNTHTKLGGYQRQPNRDQVTTYNVWPWEGSIRLKRPEHKTSFYLFNISTLPSFK